MSLRKKQSEFVRMVARLIEFATNQGYELTVGDAYRDPRSHGKMGERIAYGHPNSYHKKRLAIDFNLFRDGVWLTSSEEHRPLGEYWESIGGTWGGRFGAKDGKLGYDGNHYSYGEGR